MSNKIKIGSQQFNLNNYYQSSHKGRSCWIFDIAVSRDLVKPLIIENQTFIVISEIDEEVSERDLTDECKLFGALTEENDNTCILTMETLSKAEQDKQTIEDLQTFIDVLIGG